MTKQERLARSENNRRKQAEAAALFRALPEGERQAFIEASKKKHVEACQVRRDAQQNYVNSLKPGIEFVSKNKIPLFIGEIGMYRAVAGALLTTQEDGRVAYKVAWTIKMPNEQHVLKYAVGHVGNRLKSNDEHPYTFTIKIDGTGSIIPERLAGIIASRITLGILTKNLAVPMRLHHQLLKGWGCDFVHIPRPYSKRSSSREMNLALKAIRHVI